MRWIYSHKDAVFLAPIEPLCSNMAAMAIDKQEPLVTAITSLCLRCFVEYIFKLGNTEFVVRPAIRRGGK